ncbi:MAG: glycosyltransferase family 2 protein [Chlorobiaceae bacterium]|nr:glycosyltransferase family 2 protein [Chlorobiaceae bacterium]
MAESYSVVIPAFNAADHITDALQSILGQSAPPSEIIVVDDGSTDATASIVKAFGKPVTLICQPNRGCGAATNAGIEKVTTPLLAFLDADDVWLPEKAKIQAAILASQPEVSGVCTRSRIFRGSLSGAATGEVFDLWGRTTMMIRTEDARRIGDMIDPPGGRGDTVDWLSRGRDLGFVFIMHPEILAMRRIRPGSLSFGRDTEKDKGYLFALKRALDRKRSQSTGQEEKHDE